VPAGQPAAQPTAQQRKAGALQRQQHAARTKPIRRELERVEERMAWLQREKLELEALLAQPLAPGEIARAGKRLKGLVEELQSMEEEWLSLSAQIDAIEVDRQPS
jgi:ATP-binding cassette, subfamily F, member 3